MMKTMMGLTVNSVKSLRMVIQQTGEVLAIKPFTNWRKAIEKMGKIWCPHKGYSSSNSTEDSLWQESIRH